MAYLPTNPCCTDIVVNDPCGCTSTCNNCSTSICGTTGVLSKSVIYNGPTLPCSNAEPCDDLNVILSKMDELICILKNQQSTNTREIALMKQNIIDINNTLSTCCP